MSCFSRCPAKKVSIFTACKNRTDNLLVSIKSWIECGGVHEIIIVDWDSTINVFDQLYDIIRNSHIPIKVIRINDQPKWILTIAFNLAASLTTHPYLLKLDCDNIISRDFLKVHQLKSKTFITGFWKNSRNPNENHLNGVIYMKKKQFESVNGYNEYIQTYGWDDTDLYDRLTKNGYKNYHIDNDKIQHQEHADRGTHNTFQSIQINRLMCEEIEWNRQYPRSSFILQDFFFKKGYFVGTATNLVKPNQIAYNNAVKKYKKSYPERLFIEEYKEEVNTCHTFYANVKNGLGNRLRAFASIYNLFKHLKKNHGEWKLIVIWIPDIHCDARFIDLFKPPDDVTIISVLPRLSNDCIILPSDMQAVTSCSNVMNINMFLRNIDECKSWQTLYVQSSSIINSKYYSWNEDAKFLRNLRIRDLVTEHIHSISENFPIEEYIGVHVRLGQDLTCDDTASWTTDKRESWNKWREASSADNFIKHMKTYPEGTKFFVASDSEEVFERMKKEFPLRILYLKRNVFDRSKEQMIYAMADVKLLSKTKLLLASNWSSFSELVRRWSDIKTLLAGVDF